MTAHKILFLVIDGLSDRPCPELGNRTPLEAAHHPTLNRLAAEGVCGIMDTIATGIRPGSDTAHLALLGYDPHTCYTGRGPLECEGSGIHMEPGMIGFRCNYATVSPEGLVTDRRAGRIHDTTTLSQAIQDGVDLSKFGVEFVFRSGAGHRAALALKGEGLGHCVSSNDPKKDRVAPLTIIPVRALEKDKKTAEVCNEFVRQSEKILFDHPLNRARLAQGLRPANIVLMRGAGEMGHFEPFRKKYGLSGSVIAAASLITGIGSAVGLARVPVEGITGSQDSNIKGKITAAIHELETKDFVLVNIKGADESGHDGLAQQKEDLHREGRCRARTAPRSQRLHHHHLRRPFHALHHQGSQRRSGAGDHPGRGRPGGRCHRVRGMLLRKRRALPDHGRRPPADRAST